MSLHLLPSFSSQGWVGRPGKPLACLKSLGRHGKRYKITQVLCRRKPELKSCLCPQMTLSRPSSGFPFLSPRCSLCCVLCQKHKELGHKETTFNVLLCQHPCFLASRVRLGLGDFVSFFVSSRNSFCRPGWPGKRSQSSASLCLKGTCHRAQLKDFHCSFRQCVAVYTAKAGTEEAEAGLQAWGSQSTCVF